jgi:magnesium-transporting ATPase (P-type)
MTLKQPNEIITQNDNFAKQALRVLAFAFRELPPNSKKYTVEEVERDLVFVGLMAMMDPPRPEVEEAVKKCQRAHIRIIILDDNFATIVNAIAEGRAVYDNIKKFIVYIFAHLTPQVVPFIFFALFKTPLPITPMQIIAIDLGTETLPALALGLEPAEPGIMERPPRSKQHVSIISLSW